MKKLFVLLMALCLVGCTGKVEDEKKEPEKVFDEYVMSKKDEQLIANIVSSGYYVALTSKDNQELICYDLNSSKDEEIRSKSFTFDEPYELAKDRNGEYPMTYTLYHEQYLTITSNSISVILIQGEHKYLTSIYYSDVKEATMKQVELDTSSKENYYKDLIQKLNDYDGYELLDYYTFENNDELDVALVVKDPEKGFSIFVVKDDDVQYIALDTMNTYQEKSIHEIDGSLAYSYITEDQQVEEKTIELE